MDDHQESSTNFLSNCLKDLNKFDNFLLILHLGSLAIFISLVCSILNLSYLNFYTKIFVFLSFAIVIICLLFTILLIYWRCNNTLKATRKKIAIIMIYSQKYLSILCLILCVISCILIDYDLRNLECNNDYSTSESTNDYPSNYITDYPSESIEYDKPKFCIPINEYDKMFKNSIAVFGILLLILIFIIGIFCKNKSKIIAEINDMSQMENELQNNGQSSQSNNISNFHVNQINNNNIPNEQIGDVNTQISIEKNPKKNKHIKVKVKVENNKYKDNISSKEKFKN